MMETPPGFAVVYGIELLLSEFTIPEKAQLEAAFKPFPYPVKIVPVPMPTSQGYLLVHDSFVAELADGNMPAQVSLLFKEGLSEQPDWYTQSLQQTWGWREPARAALQRSKARIMVNDMYASLLHYQDRWSIFHNAIAGLLQLVKCEAIFWRQSQQFIDPEAYLDSFTPDALDQLYGAFNVRLFNVENTQPQEYLMDTMGLAALGLADIQCHFHGLKPPDVANVLYSVASYIFDQGPVIKDGETIQGIQPTDKWVCRIQKALIGPERAVIDVNPGQPFAAGQR